MPLTICLALISVVLAPWHWKKMRMTFRYNCSFEVFWMRWCYSVPLTLLFRVVFGYPNFVSPDCCRCWFFDIFQKAEVLFKTFAHAPNDSTGVQWKHDLAWRSAWHMLKIRPSIAKPLWCEHILKRSYVRQILFTIESMYMRQEQNSLHL